MNRKRVSRFRINPARTTVHPRFRSTTKFGPSLEAIGISVVGREAVLLAAVMPFAGTVAGTGRASDVHLDSPCRGEFGNQGSTGHWSTIVGPGIGRGRVRNVHLDHHCRRSAPARDIDTFNVTISL